MNMHDRIVKIDRLMAQLYILLEEASEDNRAFLFAKRNLEELYDKVRFQYERLSAEDE